MTSSQVSSLVIDEGQIDSIVVDQEKIKTNISVSNLVWTSGLPGIAKLLKLDLSCYRFDPPRKIVIVNLLLRLPPRMGDLHYLYCFDHEYDIFRITNFTAYCDKAPRAGGWPVSVELLMDGLLPDSEKIKLLTLNALKRLKIITSESDVIFSAVEHLNAGWPVPSVNNFQVFAGIRSNIVELGISNLALLGILSEENVFFQRDVLAQAWTKVMNTGATCE